MLNFPGVEQALPTRDGRPSSLMDGILLNWKAFRTGLHVGSDDDQEREAALQLLVEAGDRSIPVLYRIVQGHPAPACGAALALSRIGYDFGVQTVLMRSYQEEWLEQSGDPARTLRALLRLDHPSIGAALLSALATAARDRELQSCFDWITLAISALRLLLLCPQKAPIAWWIRALQFGHEALWRLRNNPFGGLAYQLTDHVRTVAVRGLLAQYRNSCLDLFTSHLSVTDVSVARTALMGIGVLKDARAVPYVTPIAFTASHPLALDARHTLESIAGDGAESLILLRSASERDDRSIPELLLRPLKTALAHNDELLRPADHNQATREPA